MRRPAEVEIAAVLTVIGSVAALAFGTLACGLSLSGDGPLERALAGLDRTLIGLMGLASVGYGAALALAAVGLLRLRSWARRLALWLDGVALAGLAYAMATGGLGDGVVAGTAVVATAAFLLLRPGVRAAFDSGMRGSIGAGLDIGR